jgi:hypothetical protein
VVARHGAECLEALKQAFENEWDDEDSRGWWPTDVQREVILALLGEGVEREWAVERLGSLQDRMLVGRDPSGRSEEYQAQANAWLKLREPGRAKQMLQGMLRVSFGVGYRKDYQLNIWIDWLGRVLSVEPQRACERISWFARATASLDDTTEGKAARYAANRLLTVVFRWSPRRTVPLLVWFIEQRCIWFVDALSELLEPALDTPRRGRVGLGPPEALCPTNRRPRISRPSDLSLGGFPPTGRRESCADGSKADRGGGRTPGHARNTLWLEEADC